MKGYKVKRIFVKTRESKAITALIEGKSGKIYVGLTAYLNCPTSIDPKTDKVTDLGRVFPETKNRVHMLDKIHNSLVKDNDGIIYFGRGIGLSWNGAGGGVTGVEAIQKKNFDMGAYEGGRMYSYNEKTGKVKDLGLMMAKNGVHTLSIHEESKMLYAYGIPDNHFYSFNIKTGEARDFGKISHYCSHNFGVAKNGNVYGGWMSLTKSVNLFKYDAKKQELFRQHQLLQYHIGQDIASNVGLDSWFTDDNGELYTGTVDGLLLKINPDTDEVSVVGKPLVEPRLTGMAKGPDGLIYMTAGYPVMHIVTYDPKTNKFNDLGQPETSHPMCYFHGVAVTKDGTIWAGETDSARSIVYKITR